MTVRCAANLRQIGQGFSGLRFDKKSGSSAPVTAFGWEIDMMPYLSNTDEPFLCPADSRPEIASMARLKVAVYSNDGTTWLFDFDLVPNAGWIQKHNETDTSYELWFEDQADTDFNDLKLKLEKLESGQTALTVLSRDAGYHFDLIRWPDRTIIFSRLGEGGGGQSYQYPTVLSSYGMNSLANGIYPGRRVILAMDYEKTTADCAGDGARDDWSDQVSPEGQYTFARHAGKCNVLFADGSVKLVAPEEINPTNAQAAARYWIP